MMPTAGRALRIRAAHNMHVGTNSLVACDEGALRPPCRGMKPERNYASPCSRRRAAGIRNNAGTRSDLLQPTQDAGTCRPRTHARACGLTASRSVPLASKQRRKVRLRFSKRSRSTLRGDGTRFQCVRRSYVQRPDASTRDAKQFPRESGTRWCTTTLAPAGAGRRDVPRRQHACLNTAALCVVPGACPCHSACLAARRKRHVSRSHGSARGRKDDYKRAQQRRYSSCGSRSSGGAGEQCALLRYASGGQAPCTLARDRAVARDAARFLLPHT